MRFGPKLRNIGRNMLEEIEVLWLKYEATRGFQFQKFSDQDDHIYIVYSGTLRKLVPTSEFKLQKFEEHQRFVVFDNMRVGDIFGEQSAILDQPNPWVIEVTSRKA